MPAFDQVSLHTQRLRLRPLADADAQALMAIFSDPTVTRYWSTPPWASIDAAREMIGRDLQAMAVGEYLRLALERLQDRALIGTCTLFALHAQCRRAELG